MKDPSKIKVLVACEESQRVAKAMAEQWGDYLLREEQ